MQSAENAEQPATPEVAKQLAVRYAPPWLVSLVVHLLAVIALALIPLAQKLKPILNIEMRYAETEGEQLLDDSITANALELIPDQSPEFSLDGNPTEAPLATMPQLEIALDAPGATLNITAPSIGMALTGREKGAKKSLLAAYGGNATTESAVERALEWLRKNQSRDGSWSLSGPYANGSTLENRTGATAMALLAFLGNGHTHREGAHRETVAKGVKALLKMQDRDGLFFHQGISGHRMYSQGMATIVVCELYAMTKDPEVKKAAELALGYAARVQASDGYSKSNQGPDGGGWRYEPGQDVDTSVTGWFVMAIQSGRMGGLEVPSEVLEKVRLYLDHVEKAEPEFGGGFKQFYYYYHTREERNVNPSGDAITAEALLCRQYLGWPRTEPKLQAGVKQILAHPVSWEAPNFYYWYYATQVLHHLGGAEWHAWNNVMRQEIPQAQVKEGKEAGSWSPEGDQYGYQGGRLYATCFCTFMLETYYRHLPLYQQSGN